MTFKQTKPSCQNLKKLVNTFLEKKTKEKLRRAMETKKPQESGLASRATSAETFRGHCKTWMKKGTCAEGDSCRWIHDQSQKGPRAGRPSRERSKTPGRLGSRSASRESSKKRSTCQNSRQRSTSSKDHRKQGKAHQ